MNQRRALAALVGTLAVLAVPACSGGSTPAPALATMSSHAYAETLLPVTEGHGNRRLADILLPAQGSFGIELSCAGSGKATVSLVPTATRLGAQCTTMAGGGGSITASAVFPAGAAERGTVSVTAPAGTRWNVTVYKVTG